MMRMMTIVRAALFALPFGFSTSASAQECDCSNFDRAVDMCKESGTDDFCIDTVSQERDTKRSLSHACIQACADAKATKNLTDDEVSALGEPADEFDDGGSDDFGTSPDPDMDWSDDEDEEEL